MEFDEEIREFLIESNENLATLDREIVQLEQNPRDMKLISSAFRTIHTIKGTCGFFGYNILGSVTHVTENILSQVREEQRELTPELISLVLEGIDAVKSLLARIEATGEEGNDETGPLRARLEEAHKAAFGAAAAAKEPGAATAEVPVAPSTIADSVSANPSSDTPPSTQVVQTAGHPVPSAPLLPVKPWSAEILAPSLSAAAEAAPVLAAAQIPASPGASGAALPAPAPLPEPGVAASSNGAKLAMPEGSRNAAADSSTDSTRDALLADSTIRVDVALLNRLMNLVGELVLARNQLLQDTSTHNPALQQTSQRLNLITSELQEGVMKTRMQPIGVVWNKLPRVVRDLASQCGKKILIEMEGAGTELDKTIIEAIKDPLTHIVRNSCDHGIETPDVRVEKKKKPEGHLLLRSYHEGGVVNIEISDDGAGIDAERVKAKAVEKGLLRADQAALLSDRDALHLIFLPGFSTAAQITSISGRGVGMDVVKTNIEKIGGSVEVMNRAEAGTTIRIRIPLTLAIIPGLVVTLDRPDRINGCGYTQGRESESFENELLKVAVSSGPGTPGPKWSREERFIIPQANLLELVRVERTEDKKRIENVHGTPVFHHRGKLLPLVYLGRVLGRKEPIESDEAVNIIVLQAENRQLGLVVDRICDTQEIVVKPLGRQLKGLICYVGATIMGDGRPALILDVAGLARLAGLGAQARQIVPAAVVSTTRSAQPQMMLLFRAGSFKRLAVPLALVDRLEEISAAKIERASGRPVLYYRGEILPLITLSTVLNPGSLDAGLGQDPDRDHVQIVVFSDGPRRLGLIVDQIVDIVNEAITVPRTTTTPGLLGSAVLGGKITDLIDLHALVALSGENWLEPTRQLAANGNTILLLDGSTVAREMIHELLRVSGYEVLQAGAVVEAMAKGRTAGLMITSAALGADLLEAIRQDRLLAHIPVLGLLDRENSAEAGPGSDRVENRAGLRNGLYDAQVVRSDRAALLAAVAALTGKPFGDPDSSAASAARRNAALQGIAGQTPAPATSAAAAMEAVL